MLNDLAKNVPMFYGSVTVGERGQVAIPAEARRDLGIAPAGKLLVFGGPEKGALIMIKAEYMTEFIANATALLSNFEQLLKSGSAEPSEETP